MSDGSEDLGRATGALVGLVFSPMFPFVMVTASGLSWLLVYGFHLREFGLLVFLARLALRYAGGHLWALLVLAALVISALPLALVAFRELAAKVSELAGAWVALGLILALTVWLDHAWPDSGSIFQAFVYAFLMLTLWAGLCRAAMGSLKLVLQSLPRPGREAVEIQKAHGHAQLASAEEAEALLSRK